MTEIYINGKAKKTESEKSKNKESGCTPDKNYAKRHNQTLAQTLRLEARQRKLYFCFFCWSFNTMFNRYLWVNRNSERPSSVGELICLRKTEQKNGQYQQFAQSNNY